MTHGIWQRLELGPPLPVQILSSAEITPGSVLLEPASPFRSFTVFTLMFQQARDLGCSILLAGSDYRPGSRNTLQVRQALYPTATDKLRLYSGSISIWPPTFTKTAQQNHWMMCEFLSLKEPVMYIDEAQDVTRLNFHLRLSEISNVSLFQSSLRSHNVMEYILKQRNDHHWSGFTQ